MIELRLLGPLDLRAPDGQPLDSVLAQPKLLALLAYLATNRPGRFLQRDLGPGLQPLWSEVLAARER